MQYTAEIDLGRGGGATPMKRLEKLMVPLGGKNMVLVPLRVFQPLVLEVHMWELWWHI